MKLINEELSINEIVESPEARREFLATEGKKDFKIIRQSAAFRIQAKSDLPAALNYYNEENFGTDPYERGFSSLLWMRSKQVSLNEQIGIDAEVDYPQHYVKRRQEIVMIPVEDAEPGSTEMRQFNKIITTFESGYFDLIDKNRIAFGAFKLLRAGELKLVENIFREIYENIDDITDSTESITNKIEKILLGSDYQEDAFDNALAESVSQSSDSSTEGFLMALKEMSLNSKVLEKSKKRVYAICAELASNIDQTITMIPVDKRSEFTRELFRMLTQSSDSEKSLLTELNNYINSSYATEALRIVGALWDRYDNHYLQLILRDFRLAGFSSVVINTIRSLFGVQDMRSKRVRNVESLKMQHNEKDRNNTRKSNSYTHKLPIKYRYHY